MLSYAERSSCRQPCVVCLTCFDLNFHGCSLWFGGNYSQIMCVQPLSSPCLTHHLSAFLRVSLSCQPNFSTGFFKDCFISSKCLFITAHFGTLAEILSFLRSLILCECSCKWQMLFSCHKFTVILLHLKTLRRDGTVPFFAPHFIYLDALRRMIQ